MRAYFPLNFEEPAKAPAFSSRFAQRPIGTTPFSARGASRGGGGGRQAETVRLDQSRHAPTVTTVTPTLVAIWVSGIPSAAINSVRAGHLTVRRGLRPRQHY